VERFSRRAFAEKSAGAIGASSAGLEARALMVSTGRITLTGRVTGDVQEVVRAFRAMGGWKVAEPRLTSSAQGVLCVLDMERVTGIPE
jgi:hypothetical protein